MLDGTDRKELFVMIQPETRREEEYSEEKGWFARQCNINANRSVNNGGKCRNYINSYIDKYKVMTVTTRDNTATVREIIEMILEK